MLILLLGAIELLVCNVAYLTKNLIKSTHGRVMLALRIELINNADPTGPKIAFPLPGAGGLTTSLGEMAPTGRGPTSALQVSQTCFSRLYHKHHILGKVLSSLHWNHLLHCNLL